MFRAKTITTLFFLCLILFAGCNKEKTKNITMTIASKQVRFPKNAINPSRYIVKLADDEEWSLFYNAIEGFDYQEGYEYVLSVKVITLNKPPMADAGTKEYYLNHIISREEKASVGIPEAWFVED